MRTFLSLICSLFTSKKMDRLDGLVTDATVQTVII